MSVRAKKLEIYHCLSFAPTETPQVIEFGSPTVFIGPNNAGKSTTIRILQLIAKFIRERGLTREGKLNSSFVDLSWWGQHEPKSPVRAVLTLEVPQRFREHHGAALDAYAKDGVITLEMALKFDGDNVV